MGAIALYCACLVCFCWCNSLPASESYWCRGSATAAVSVALLDGIFVACTNCLWNVACLIYSSCTEEELVVGSHRTGHPQHTGMLQWSIVGPNKHVLSSQTSECWCCSSIVCAKQTKWSQKGRQVCNVFLCNCRNSLRAWPKQVVQSSAVLIGEF